MRIFSLRLDLHQRPEETQQYCCTSACNDAEGVDLQLRTRRKNVGRSEPYQQVAPIHTVIRPVDNFLTSPAPNNVHLYQLLAGNNSCSRTATLAKLRKCKEFSKLNDINIMLCVRISSDNVIKCIVVHNYCSNHHTEIKAHVHV